VYASRRSRRSLHERCARPTIYENESNFLFCHSEYSKESRAIYAAQLRRTRNWIPRYAQNDKRGGREQLIHAAKPPNPMSTPSVFSIPAEPYAFDLTPAVAALLIIDMQRDFLEPGGFGAALGNDVLQLRRTIAPNRKLLAAWRELGLPVLHTREGHRPDLTDLCPSKKIRGRGATSIGDMGPMGRILIRGEPGHDIISELAPLPSEPVIDKPGKGAFFATNLHNILQASGIRQLVVTGVTTEVCVNSTVREANDRGYECLVPSDCVGSYFPEFHTFGLAMIKAQGGIFGWVTDSKKILRELSNMRPGSAR
jgi:nicotinamidase-related amidase